MEQGARRSAGDESATPGDGAIKVLVADSDPRVRRALRALIETDPRMIVVAEAGSTSEVLEYDNTLTPAVIVLDLILPCMEEGMALLHHLVGKQGRAVVAISMRGGLRGVALAAGAQAFVEKGTATDVLLLQALRAAGQTICERPAHPRCTICW